MRGGGARKKSAGAKLYNSRVHNAGSSAQFHLGGPRGRPFGKFFFFFFLCFFFPDKGLRAICFGLRVILKNGKGGGCGGRLKKFVISFHFVHSSTVGWGRRVQRGGGGAHPPLGGGGARFSICKGRIYEYF